MRVKTPGEQQCSLCQLPLEAHSISNGEQSFCCHGCHTVYNILESKSALDGFKDNPIFKQAVEAGLISNPALLQSLQNKTVDAPEEEFQKLHLEVLEMWCPSCAEVIKLMFLQEKGIRSCVVDYSTDLASVEFAPRHISKEKIFSIINSLGYAAQSLQSQERKAVSKSLIYRFGVAVFCAMNIMMFSYPIYADYFGVSTRGYAKMFSLLSLVMALPIVSFCSWPILRRFWNGILTGLLGMETLVVLGVSTAFGTSLFQLSQGDTHVYFDSMAMIVVFVLLGKIIEAKAKFSAKESLLRLNQAIPRRGRKVFSDGSSQFVPIKEIKEGDNLSVLTGERIVLDGIILNGNGAADESLMTGEVIPVPKKEGDSILCGSILKQGSLTFRVTTTADNSALQRIINTVQEDLSGKTLYTRAVDHIVRWFVPVAVVLATLTGIFTYLNGLPLTESILRTTSVLLISCPCAIGIAAPLAESLLMNGLASLGAIVRNRGCLKILGKEEAFVFDKTGTVTTGKFKVLSGFETLTKNELSTLKSIASQSTHPISQTISEAIELTPTPQENLEEMVGRGMRCEDYLLGSATFMKENDIPIKEENENQNILTKVYFSKGKSLITTILLGDELKPNIKPLISSLDDTHLLSGDSPSTVEKVAKLCKFKKYKGGVNPLEKREYIQNLRNKNKIVMMIGDGINDAPALALANIGYSVVSATDISIQVSDVLLTTQNLSVIAKIRKLGIMGQRIIKQNLFWAFFYNILGIPLAMLGILAPIYASIAMVLSSLIVLFNARRLRGSAP